MVQGQVFLKKGVGTFPIIPYYFILYKIVLCIWRKIIFSAIRILWKKSISKLSKDEPECICKEGWCVTLEQEGSWLHKGWGSVWNSS